MQCQRKARLYLGTELEVTHVITSWGKEIPGHWLLSAVELN